MTKTLIAAAVGSLLLGGVAVAAVPDPDPCQSMSGKAYQKCRFDRLENKVDALAAQLAAQTDTTPTPTPTPAPTPTPSGDVCTQPVFTTTSSNGGRTFGEYYVHNNLWNNSNGIYSLGACSAASWYVVADQPRPSDNGVQAYPNVHKDYNDEPLTSIVSADFAATAPRCAGCIWNVGFDVWINQNLTNELMIWTENHGQRPAGTRLADKVIGGRTYQVWKSGGSTSPGGIFTYVSATTQTAGTMPLGLFFDDLKSRGWIAQNSTTWQVDYGVEVVSTEGNPERFDFTDFSITER